MYNNKYKYIIKLFIYSEQKILKKLKTHFHLNSIFE